MRIRHNQQYTRHALKASLFYLLGMISAFLPSSEGAEPAAPLPRVRPAPDGRSWITAQNQPFIPLGINYFRPGTGWAPQLWKQFDATAVRQDFARMKELGINCVRVFLTYGSFFTQTNSLESAGLDKLDQFLNIAEAHGIYVHPTGPDHWEGLPEWARGDRIADDKVLTALETFWTLLARRYQGRAVIFAYDLLNEPAVGWDTPALRSKWNSWLIEKYGSPTNAAKAWRISPEAIQWNNQPPPAAKDAPGNPQLLDYQHFREQMADDWTRRQSAAIKKADPQALVTVGFIQWSIPSLLPGVSQYAAFRPSRQARYLDFMEVHFYPFNNGFFEYQNENETIGNLAYLHSVVRETASVGKPVVLAEFGWYGGGKLTINQGKHPAATEIQQANWCVKAIEVTSGLASGWLNWGLYDHPEAKDVTQLTGLLTVQGKNKAWADSFKQLSQKTMPILITQDILSRLPILDWDAAITDRQVGNRFRQQYHEIMRSVLSQER